MSDPFLVRNALSRLSALRPALSVGQTQKKISILFLRSQGHDGNFELCVERANYSVVSKSWLAPSLYNFQFFCELCELPNYVGD